MVVATYDLTGYKTTQQYGVNIVGSSEGIKKVLGLVKRFAPSTLPVLITGEVGTGKELVARAIHHLSPRNKSRFIDVNCASLHQDGVHNEFFGHKKGSYTGALENAIGIFEAAHLGTLFLDEIGDMPSYIQAAVLRALSEKRIYRLGSTERIDLDFRVIAATNKNLDDEISGGRFRSDLYSRLAGGTIELPPLRDRREDISELIEHFLYKYANEDKKIAKFNAESVELLAGHSWPGNIRELELFVRRAILMHGVAWNPGDRPPMPLQSVEEMIYLNYLTAESRIRPLDAHTTREVLLMSSQSSGNSLGNTHTPDLPKIPSSLGYAVANAVDEAYQKGHGTYRELVNICERAIIISAIERAEGNVTHAAKTLNISRSLMTNKMAEFGISSRDFKKR